VTGPLGQKRGRKREKDSEVGGTVGVPAYLPTSFLVTFSLLTQSALWIRRNSSWEAAQPNSGGDAHTIYWQ
jgi:hypothetical protein